MLDNHQAITYGHCAEKLQRVHNGDRLFLYSNRNGIKAIGIASGNVNRQIENETDVSSMNLVQFRIINVPLRSTQIKRITRRNYSFSNTLFSLTDRHGQLIWDFIEANL